VLLIGLGYQSLSVAPPTLLLLKWLLRHIPLEACQRAAAEALEAKNVAEVAAVLQHQVQPYLDLRLLDPHGPLPGRAGLP
jgi:signal transduction protein with GAF and PtsI domain